MARIALSKFEEADSLYFVEVTCETDKERLTVSFHFEKTWNHSLSARFEHSDVFNLEGIRTLGSDLTTKDLEDLTFQTLKHSVVHIPDYLFREIFYRTINTWALYVNCPLEIRMLKQPTYPLLIVQYNDAIISSKDVGALLDEVLHAISIAKSVRTAKEVEETERIEQEEELDEADALDFELDAETAKLIHLPEESIRPMDAHQMYDLVEKEEGEEE